jgi:hypothetical protein
MPSRIKIAIGLIVAMCAIALPATSAIASEADEFQKVGNKLTSEGGETVFVFSIASVDCEKNSGTGGVASSTQVKAEVTFSKCKAKLNNEESEIQTKITPCNVNVHAEDTVTLEGGCKAEAKLLGLTCIIEPSSTKNANLEGTGIFGVKEEESSLESEIALEVVGITYKANSNCEAAGVKGGSEGEVLSLEPMEVHQLGSLPYRRFSIKASSPAAPRTVLLESTNTHELALSSTAKVTCGQIKASGTVGAGVTVLRDLKVGTLKYSKCMTNILGSTEPATMSAGAPCEMLLLAYNNISPAAGVSVFAPPTTCQVTIKVGACVVTLTSGRDARLYFTNNGGAPETIGIKYNPSGGSTSSRVPFRVNSPASCNNLQSDIGFYKGESKLRAETATGAGADIKIV